MKTSTHGLTRAYRRLVVTLLAGPVCLAACGATPPGPNRFGSKAYDIATLIGCGDTSEVGGTDEMSIHDEALCTVDGKRLDIETFKDDSQQKSWRKTMLTLVYQDGFWVAQGKGFVVMSNDDPETDSTSIRKPAAALGVDVVKIE